MWIRLAGLLSFCGGPMVVADALKPSLGNPAHFLVAFIPVGLLVGGMAGLSDHPVRSVSRGAAWAGLAGLLILAIMNVFGVTTLLHDPGRGDAGLVALGIAVGVLVSVVYPVAFVRWRRGFAS